MGCELFGGLIFLGLPSTAGTKKKNKQNKKTKHMLKKKIMFNESLKSRRRQTPWNFIILL